MKKYNLLYLLLLCSCTTWYRDSDSKSNDLVIKELKRISHLYSGDYYTSGKTKDSIIVDKQILLFDIKEPSLKNWCIANKELSKQEADEIFGTDNNLFDIHPNPRKEWDYKVFANQKITLFDANTKNKERLILRVSNIVHSVSMPIIRNDGKYALIQSANVNDGGMLAIYKKTQKDWVLYKVVYLYLI